MSRFDPRPTPNGLAQAVILALAKDYHAHGTAVIAELRKNEPRNYLKLILSLLEVELPSEKSAAGSLSDDEFDALIEGAQDALAKIDAWEKEAEAEEAAERAAHGEGAS